MKVEEGILQSVVDNLNEVIVPRAENLRSNVEALEYPSDDPIFPAGGKIDFNFYIDSMWSTMSNAAHAVENFLNLYQGKESENEEIAAILGAEIAGLDGATYMADVWGNGNKGTFSDDGTYTVDRLAMLDKDGKLLLNVDLTDEKYKGKSLDEIKEIVAKAFPRGNGKPEWSYINNQLKDEYPQVDVARLKAVLASPVSADETKDKKVVAPLVIFDKNGEYNRGEPEREAPVKQSSKGTGKGNSKRFNVVTRFTRVINGVVHYYLKPPGGAAYEVSQADYNASSYKEE